MKGSFCPSCGWQGKPIVITKGNIGTELILWLFFLLPGVCYSVWRHASRYKGCPQCGANPIPIDSPVALQLIAKLKLNEQPAAKKRPAPASDQDDGQDRPKVYVIK